MAHDITITGSQHVSISIDDPAKYEALVNARIALREAELADIHAKELALKDKELALSAKDLALKADEAALLKDRVALLQQQQAEDRKRLQNIDAAFAEFRATIEKLEILLSEATHATAKIGENRIADAKAAVEQGDYRAADIIFAEVQEIENAAVMRSADASYGRGLIAEQEIRWHDAAKHYATAAQLNPGFDNLHKAREYAWRAGSYPAAFRFGEDLLVWAKNQGSQEQLATALNEHALTLDEQGNYLQAEVMFREALEIGRATIGTNHPDYATRLNNLANMLRAAGRYSEAEVHYREALAIDRITNGTKHPIYAIHLNNLAEALRMQGRYAEAEPMYLQALEIARATIGTNHPDYGAHLNNYAEALRGQGRYSESEALYRVALTIDRATIGATHPHYSIHLNNLALVVQAQGRFAEARGHYAQSVTIRRDKLGEGHPATKRGACNYLAFLQSQFPDDPEIPALQALLATNP